MPVIDISNVTEEQVTRLRERFLKFEDEEIDEGSKIPKRFDSRDVEQIKTDDSTIKFYMTHKALNEEDALTMMKTSLAWRKEYGVRDINFDSFPENIKSSNAVSIHGTDKEGRRIIWMYMSRAKRPKSELDLWCRYMTYHIEKLYQQRGQGRLIFVGDLTGVGLTTFDYDLTGFAIKVFENYYPDLLTFQVNFNMAWTLKTAWNIIKTWMTAEAVSRVKFAKGAELEEFVCSEFIPVHMGGQFK